MSEKSTSTTGGIGLFGMLGVLFIALKLTGYIDWSWWWVLAPLWDGFIFVFCVSFIILLVVELSKKR